jgi:hypothetical protein
VVFLGQDGKVIITTIKTGAMLLLTEADPGLKIVKGKDILSPAYIANQSGP